MAAMLSGSPVVQSMRVVPGVSLRPATHLRDDVGGGQAEEDGAALVGDLLGGGGAEAAFGDQVVAEDGVARGGEPGGDGGPEEADADEPDGVHMQLLYRVTVARD